MGNYAADFQRTNDTTKTTGTISAPGSSPRRLSIYEIIIGSEGAVADNPFLWTIQRTTAAGTSTAVTPQALDPADAACVAVGGENHTVEPTYTASAILMNIALNQRATFRFCAAPGGEIVTPASNNAGVGFKAGVGGAVLVTVQTHFQE